ncbi:hypothetical protein WN48_02504 [Eufriesea mexicana]|nr:hypothetical protein WN48_02504 [Eufriesea mexicana]
MASVITRFGHWYVSIVGEHRPGPLRTLRIRMTNDWDWGAKFSNRKRKGGMESCELNISRSNSQCSDLEFVDGIRKQVGEKQGENRMSESVDTKMEQHDFPSLLMGPKETHTLSSKIMKEKSANYQGSKEDQKFYKFKVLPKKKSKNSLKPKAKIWKIFQKSEETSKDVKEKSESTTTKEPDFEEKPNNGHGVTKRPGQLAASGIPVAIHPISPNFLFTYGSDEKFLFGVNTFAQPVAGIEIEAVPRSAARWPDVKFYFRNSYSVPFVVRINHIRSAENGAGPEEVRLNMECGNGKNKREIARSVHESKDPRSAKENHSAGKKEPPELTLEGARLPSMHHSPPREDNRGWLRKKKRRKVDWNAHTRLCSCGSPIVDHVAGSAVQDPGHCQLTPGSSWIDEGCSSHRTLPGSPLPTTASPFDSPRIDGHDLCHCWIQRRPSSIQLLGRRTVAVRGRIRTAEADEGSRRQALDAAGRVRAAIEESRHEGTQASRVADRDDEHRLTDRRPSGSTGRRAIAGRHRPPGWRRTSGFSRFVPGVACSLCPTHLVSA